jgi:hypothetical protein
MNRFPIAVLVAISAGLPGLTRDLRAQTIPPLIIPTMPPRDQAVEVAPFAGYRFGGDFFELVTGQAVDLDGAPAWGASVDVPLPKRGLYFEGLFTHQHANLVVPPPAFGPPRLWHVTVEHWQAGALQEVGDGRARPFINLMAGLTRFSAEGDNEIRFAGTLGAGAKLLPTPRLGIRLESRVFGTLVDASGGLACSSGLCLVALSAQVVWQWEFSAGLVLRFH